MKLLPILNSDSYKQLHNLMYPKGITKLYSNMTPRSFKRLGCDYAVWFGLQYYIKEYMISQWNELFFNQPKELIVAQYKRFHKHFSFMEIDTTHIEALHDLGYLPISIKALPEGSLVPARVPFFTITNTHPDFAWLVNFLETQMSTVIWDLTTNATIAYMYKEKLDSWAKKTGDESFVQWQGHDFSQRGRSSVESTFNQAGHLLSFTGTDTIPAVLFLEEYYGANIEKELVGSSVPACFPEDAEILTENGFKRFYDLDKDEKVAQYNKDGNINFVVPTKYHEYYFDGELEEYSSTSLEVKVTQKVTPNHRIVYKNRTGLRIKESENFTPKIGYQFIVSGLHEGNIKVLSNEEKLLIAFQADGSYSGRSEQYTGKRTGTIPIRFSLKKERKAVRLTQLLEELGYEYSKNQYENGYYSFRVNVPIYLKLSKTFDWVNIIDKDWRWGKDFIEELQFWDGNKSRKNIISYSSIEKYNLDVIQAVCAISGQKSTLTKYEDKRTDCNRRPIYHSCIHTNISEVHIGNVIKEKVPYKGNVYCVTVPSGMIIVRQNNNVFVSGNSEHSVMTSYGKESEQDAFERLLNIFPEGILSVVSDSFDLWKVCTEYVGNLKDKILSRNGKLVIRPDSGDPVDIVCGLNTNEEIERYSTTSTPEQIKGVVELLWDVFGGTVNEKGYKVLDSHIGVIYGDSINLERAEQICKRLEKKGFASTNVVLGIGSYTYNCNTRDSLGIAVKSTYCEVDGVPREIFKDPITDDGTKKSLKGLLYVGQKDGQLFVEDQVSPEKEATGLLTEVFKNGRMVVETNLQEIRERVKNS